MAKEKAEIIKPPNNLRDKVSVTGPGVVDEAMLKKGEQVIADMAGSYLEWMQEDLAKIQAAYETLATGDGDIKSNMDAVFKVSLDIKGQGGSFNYDLMTAIGGELCNLIEKLGKEPGRSEIEAVKIHIDAMHLVIQNRMTGNGGAQGKAILMGIQKVCDKLLA